MAENGTATRERVGNDAGRVRIPRSLIVFGILVIGLAAVYFFYRGMMLRRQLECAVNLKNFEATVSANWNAYCDEPAGCDADRVVKALVANGLLRADQTKCPAGGGAYMLVRYDNRAGGKIASDVPVAYESPANHDGRGANVVFADGHAEFVHREALRALIKASLPVTEKVDAGRADPGE